MVTLLTDANASTRSAGLSSLRSTARFAPAEERLLILKEDGMLGALQQFIEPDSMQETGEAAIDLLWQLTDSKGVNNLSVAEMACKRCVFGSPLFPLIVQATTVHRNSFNVIRTLSLVNTLKKELFEFPGVTEALARGLNTDDEDIQIICITTVSNITTVHVFDLNEFPELISGIVDKFTTQGIGGAFWCK
jgi:hypothetical protein